MRHALTFALFALSAAPAFAGFEWFPVGGNDNEHALYWHDQAGYHHQGNWAHAPGHYRAYIGQSPDGVHRFGPPQAHAPVMPPQRPLPTGVILDKLQHGEHASYKGKEIPPATVPDIFKGKTDPSKLVDDSGLYRLSVLESDKAKRDQFIKQFREGAAYAPLRGKALPWEGEPQDWSYTTGGFVPADHAAYLQDARGNVVAFAAGIDVADPGAVLGALVAANRPELAKLMGPAVQEFAAAGQVRSPLPPADHDPAAYPTPQNPVEPSLLPFLGKIPLRVKEGLAAFFIVTGAGAGVTYHLKRRKLGHAL